MLFAEVYESRNSTRTRRSRRWVSVGTQDTCTNAFGMVAWVRKVRGTATVHIPGTNVRHAWSILSAVRFHCTLMRRNRVTLLQA
jgi:hypothetical protein